MLGHKERVFFCVCFKHVCVGGVRGLTSGYATVRCRSRRYGGSRLLIKCQTKQKSVSVFFSGIRPTICSPFIHSLTCRLCVCVDMCPRARVCVNVHSSQQPLAGQVHNVTDVVVRSQQLCVRWPRHMTAGGTPLARTYS